MQKTYLFTYSVLQNAKLASKCNKIGSIDFLPKHLNEKYIFPHHLQILISAIVV
jgi:hypothetical protein